MKVKRKTEYIIRLEEREVRVALAFILEAFLREYSTNKDFMESIDLAEELWTEVVEPAVNTEQHD